MKQIEIISLFHDYSEYVQECFLNGIKSQTKDEFKYSWDGIWNADLVKMNSGDTIYLDRGEGLFIKTTIIEVIIENDGERSQCVHSA